MIVRFVFCLILLITPFHVLAQDSDEKAKDKQVRQTALITQILGDVPNLKLGENRAVVYAKAGNLIWKIDEKRARALFQNAVGELIGAQTLAEADTKNIGYQNDLLTGQNTRPQILNIIASRDAETALDYLVKTRPAKILKALTYTAGKSSKINDSSNNYGYIAQNELNLEQSFIRMAADQNPERAAKLLRESLKKGFSGETFNLLRKLSEKDAVAANEMASEIVGKLIETGFNAENQNYSQNFNIAIYFLNEYIREKGQSEKFIRFDDSQMRALADKLIAYSLQQNYRYGNYGYSILPIAEKLAPGSVTKLKQAQNNIQRHSFGMEYDPEVSKLLSNGETTAETMLSEAAKFPVNSRRQIYQTAANKFAQQGNMSRAAEVLTDNFSDDALEQSLQNLNWQYSYSLISTGKFNEAERIIDGFPENTRSGALVNLANAIYQKNPEENKSYAASVLEKARASISNQPEDSTEMSMLMQIISAYSTIEPTESFRLLESLTSQINELSEAAAITYGFQKNSNIKQGEFLLNSGYPANTYLNDPSVIGRLAANDFDRTMSLINGYNRRESRIALRLQLAETIFSL